MDSTPLAFSINAFCEVHHVSRSEYYVLRNRGLAPREMRLGRKVLISAEAAARWRREREQATAEAAAA